MPETQQSDALKNLVIFIICLAILGTILALVWYFAVDLPAQLAVLHSPANVWVAPAYPVPEGAELPVSASEWEWEHWGYPGSI